MIASNSTFCRHQGKVISDLYRLLHAVRHGTEALIYNDHPREAAASLCLVIIFGRSASGTLVSPLNSGANAALAPVQVLV